MNSLYVDVLIDWYERFEENFGVSWLMVCELVDLDLDSHEVFHCGYVRSELAPLFGDGQKKFPQDFPESEKIHYCGILKPLRKDTVKVQWNTS
ncbi:hypothetical protein VU04_12040 [Desulfobulbus sp. TB]|nr:hypothetical protein [Desulfobulbus sp. TB]